MHSTLATQIPPTTTTGIKIRSPWGLCIHTTGSGVPEAAKKRKKAPIDVALDIYLKSQSGKLHKYKWGGPTYVLDHNGALFQICADNIRTAHCGGPWRAQYLDGSWKDLSWPAAVEAWRKQWWPKYKSPQHLFPSRDPNIDYVGVEVIPCGAGFGTPMRPGLKFTQAQHDTLVLLARDLEERHGWPLGWERTPRLVGHEDLQPVKYIDGDPVFGMGRSNASGGWDPGWLRKAPFFDFEYVRSRVRMVDSAWVEDVTRRVMDLIRFF